MAARVGEGGGQQPYLSSTCRGAGQPGPGQAGDPGSPAGHPQAEIERPVGTRRGLGYPSSPLCTQYISICSLAQADLVRQQFLCYVKYLKRTVSRGEYVSIRFLNLYYLALFI